MKKSLIFILISAIFLQSADAQFLNRLKKIINTNPASLSEEDAVAGIKEALITGTNESVRLVSVQDGYWANPEIKIPFPSEARDMETVLRKLGMGRKIDEFNESMNHAAEKAANEAKSIFISAIRGLTVKDALNIVKGEDNAATMYLKNTTSQELKEKFQPVINNSLQSVKATSYWDDLISTYNKVPLVKKMNPDLSAYVTDKAIDGLFIMIAKEELKIRKDPVARTTELLKKVFGN